MILPLRLRGHRGDELDLARCDGGAEPAAGEREQVAVQFLAGLVTVGFSATNALTIVAGDRVGLADHPGLGDGRMLQQRRSPPRTGRSGARPT